MVVVANCHQSTWPLATTNCYQTAPTTANHHQHLLPNSINSANHHHQLAQVDTGASNMLLLLEVKGDVRIGNWVDGQLTGAKVIQYKTFSVSCKHTGGCM